MPCEWADWVKHHAMLFAMLNPAEEKMLVEWAALLGLRGWTADEAWKASEWLAIHEPPSYRDKHLHALEKRLPIVRSQQATHSRPEEHPLGTCVICRGDGLVSVPARRRRKDGSWFTPDPINDGHFYTMVVACWCALGRWKQQHCFGDKGIIDLSEYEAANPDWRQELGDYESYLRRASAVRHLSRDLDEALGAIRRRQQNLRNEEKKTCLSESR